MKVCPKCGRKWPDHAKFCPVDGELLQEESKEDNTAAKNRVEKKKEPKGQPKFSETKWFMVGEHLDEIDDVSTEDLPPEDLNKVYKKENELPKEIRKKYSLEFTDKEDK